MTVLGKNIIENLTTGMYEDCNIIYREYIQNSADQIKKAISCGILKPEDALIDITINKKNRSIIIFDNATGIPESDFEKNYLLSQIQTRTEKKAQDLEELEDWVALHIVIH